jgi:hypothetical protein
LGFNVGSCDGIALQTNAFIARRGWAEKNRAIMVRFMKAHVLAMRWLFDNKDAAVEFLSQEMKLKPQHARLGWEFYTQNRHWPPDGDVTIEGMKNNIRIYAELTGPKARCRTPRNMSIAVICLKRSRSLSGASGSDDERFLAALEMTSGWRSSQSACKPSTPSLLCGGGFVELPRCGCYF